MAQQAEHLATLADELAEGFGRGARAAIGHALEFETWRSLVRRQRLSRRSAVDAMMLLATTMPSRAANGRGG